LKCPSRNHRYGSVCLYYQSQCSRRALAVSAASENVDSQSPPHVVLPIAMLHPAGLQMMDMKHRAGAMTLGAKHRADATTLAMRHRAAVMMLEARHRAGAMTLAVMTLVVGAASGAAVANGSRKCSADCVAVRAAVAKPIGANGTTIRLDAKHAIAMETGPANLAVTVLPIGINLAWLSDMRQEKVL